MPNHTYCRDLKKSSNSMRFALSWSLPPLLTYYISLFDGVFHCRRASAARGMSGHCRRSSACDRAMPDCQRKSNPEIPSNIVLPAVSGFWTTLIWQGLFGFRLKPIFSTLKVVKSDTN